VIGDGAHEGTSEFGIRVTFDGWSAGVTPVTKGTRLAELREFTPAGVFAGALAVAESFQFVRHDNATAGRREVGLSLWRPAPDVDWRTADTGPMLRRLPSSLWLIGLGHLGQALLWTLGFLPYAEPSAVRLVLQDVDHIGDANLSTGLLTTPALRGTKKTRAMAAWCEQRGFNTSVVERRFDADFRVNDSEPRLALCSVDKPQPRAAIEDVGFSRIIEAGLGRGWHEFMAFQLHSFPSERTAREKWGGVVDTGLDESLLSKPGYRALSEAGVDRCGLALLAEQAVGVPFIGAAVAALMASECLRILIGEPLHAVIDGTFRNLDRRHVVSNTRALEPFNPGATNAL
jgi:hypothetical protein